MRKKNLQNIPELFLKPVSFRRRPGGDIFSVPLFRLKSFSLILIFHFENLSNFIIFKKNEDVRRIEPQTNNHNYRTTRPARDELPDLRF